VHVALDLRATPTALPVQAFFWFGICFNNHQSLIVIVLGMEIAVLFAAPRLLEISSSGHHLLPGRIVPDAIDMVTNLKDNRCCFSFTNLIGIGSFHPLGQPPGEHTHQRHGIPS